MRSGGWDPGVGIKGMGSWGMDHEDGILGTMGSRRWDHGDGILGTTGSWGWDHGHGIRETGSSGWDPGDGIIGMRSKGRDPGDNEDEIVGTKWVPPSATMHQMTQLCIYRHAPSATMPQPRCHQLPPCTKSHGSPCTTMPQVPPGAMMHQELQISMYHHATRCHRALNTLVLHVPQGTK